VCNVHGYQLDMNREGERHIWKSPISGDKRAGEGGGGRGSKSCLCEWGVKARVSEGVRVRGGLGGEGDEGEYECKSEYEGEC